MIAIVALEFKFGYVDCIDMPITTLEWFSDKAQERMEKKKKESSKAASSARSSKGRGRRR